MHYFLFILKLVPPTAHFAHTDGRKQPIYVGCYAIDNAKTQLDGHTIEKTLDQCRVLAEQQQSHYFGVAPSGNKGDVRCLMAGNSVPSMKKTTDSQCDATKNSRHQRLGAQQRLALYALTGMHSVEMYF